MNEPEYPRLLIWSSNLFGLLFGLGSAYCYHLYIDSKKQLNDVTKQAGVQSVDQVAKSFDKEAEPAYKLVSGVLVKDKLSSKNSHALLRTET